MDGTNNLATSLDITKASFNVVWKDPELLLLPVISAFVFLAVLVSIIFLFKIPENTNPLQGITAIVALYFAFYFLLCFIKAAAIEAARIRFSGGDPKLGDGFSKAASHLKSIAALSLISAVLAIIRTVLGLGGKKNASLSESVLRIGGATLIDFGWIFASHFSLPVIMYENLGVKRSFDRSVKIMKNTLEETTAVHATMVALFIPGLLGVLLIIAALKLFGPNLTMIVALFALTVLLFIAGFFIHTVVNGVVTEALYLYATTGKKPKELTA